MKFLFSLLIVYIIARVVSYDCPMEGTAYVPDRENCSQFYQCSNGEGILLTCPSGLWFNRQMNYCDYIRNHPLQEGCGYSECLDAKNGTLPVEGDCELYIQCRGKYAQLMTCCYLHPKEDYIALEKDDVAPNKNDNCYYDAETQECVTKENCNCLSSCKDDELST